MFTSIQDWILDLPSRIELAMNQMSVVQWGVVSVTVVVLGFLALKSRAI